MLQTLRIELTGMRGAMLAALLSGLLAAPVGCSSSSPTPVTVQTVNAWTEGSMNKGNRW
jgi:hypothetical protein